jgi:hypothetical protein
MTYAQAHGIRSDSQILDEDCWRFLERTLPYLDLYSSGDGQCVIAGRDNEDDLWYSHKQPLKEAVKQAIMELEAF